MNTKIKIFIAAMAMLVATTDGFAQYTINGFIKNNAVDDMIYLSSQGSEQDSCQLQNGRFTLKAPKPNGPDYVVAHGKKIGVVAMLWVEEGTVNITVDSAKVEITGSKLQDDYVEYNKALQPVIDEMKSVSNKERALLNAGEFEEYYALDATRYIEEVLRPKEDSIFIAFAESHPRSHICLNHVYNCRVLEKYDFDRYMNMLNMLDTTAFHGKQWETMKELIAKDRMLEKGAIMPDFHAQDVFGKEVKVSDFRGKYVLVSLASSTLKDYLEDNKVKRELYKRLRDKGFEIVDILLDEAHHKIVKVIANDKITWNVLSDGKGWRSPFLYEYGLDHISQTWLLNKNGVIIKRNAHGEDLKQLVEENVR